MQGDIRLTEHDPLAAAGAMVFDCRPQVLPGAIDVSGTELAPRHWPEPIRRHQQSSPPSHMHRQEKTALSTGPIRDKRHRSRPSHPQTGPNARPLIVIVIVERAVASPHG